MEEAYVDTIIRYSQEVSRWFEEDLGSEVVTWFDVAPFMTAHLFQLQFAGNEQCWHSSRLITLKLFRTDHNNAPLVLVCVGWFHVDTNSGIPKKFFVGEIVS